MEATAQRRQQRRLKESSPRQRRSNGLQET
jgi:hypothetical protein